MAAAILHHVAGWHGLALGLVHRWGWGRLALRVAGGLVAAAGAFFLWRALA